MSPPVESSWRKASVLTLFLEDHSSHQPGVQYWKYAVIGCSLNIELNVWSCESWTCLQTICVWSRGWRGSHGGQCGGVCHAFTHPVLRVLEMVKQKVEEEDMIENYDKQEKTGQALLRAAQVFAGVFHHL